MPNEPLGNGPYGLAAAAYYASGWRGVLPLPPRAKHPVPVGYTGADGLTPSRADIETWVEDRPESNVALRLPPDLIGIDVDAYGGKGGWATLIGLQAHLGVLPQTWMTTSRTDESGIRLFRLWTPGLKWPGTLGPGIDTIRHGHRYAVVWPSVHPEDGSTNGGGAEVAPTATTYRPSRTFPISRMSGPAILPMERWRWLGRRLKQPPMRWPNGLKLMGMGSPARKRGGSSIVTSGPTWRGRLGTIGWLPRYSPWS